MRPKVPVEALSLLGRTVVIAYGCGTDSTAMVVDLVNKGAHPPAALLFADTGGERLRTYLYLEVFDDWLKAHGWPYITVVQKHGNRRTLEQDCLIKNMLPSVAYGYKTCSHKFKIEPQEKWCNNNSECRTAWKAGEKVIKLIGYGKNELHRVKVLEDKKYEYRYPNLDNGIDKEGAQRLIRAAGLPLPGKSACFFCPNSTKAEIEDLRRQEPEALSRALALEANARLTKIKGLGRRFSWRDFVAGLPTPDDDPETGVCGCVSL